MRTPYPLSFRGRSPPLVSAAPRRAGFLSPTRPEVNRSSNIERRFGRKGKPPRGRRGFSKILLRGHPRSANLASRHASFGHRAKRRSLLPLGWDIPELRSIESVLTWAQGRGLSLLHLVVATPLHYQLPSLA